VNRTSNPQRGKTYQSKRQWSATRKNKQGDLPNTCNMLLKENSWQQIQVNSLFVGSVRS